MKPGLLMMGKVAGRGRVWSDWLLVSVRPLHVGQVLT